ncbi:helix-turn-helix domain-containing protein [Variovorax sp. WS11]|uniref:helix-turn-helix domain-containing protein n=1 Tax=Variovorax sp. WS11 TaxID=1105204 RepID=UPI0013DA7D6E|nr:helix-turn-helix domain-containing protein [Variovorax sp. WS11]NDZ14460.1 helix-turn-helix domain-containing protein [Variovorax sp. WS11]
MQTGLSRSKATTIREALHRGQQSHLFLEDLKKQGLLTVQTVRIRPKGEPDRRFVVEYAVDPQEPTAVILRVRPASTAELGAESPEMLTTQQAADRLNVSRPYVARLADAGTFQGVERTQSGHRRIPRKEVDRVQGEMRASREAAFLEMDSITTEQRARELNAARAKPKRPWVKTS